MQQLEILNRERSLSNNSSMQTPKLRRKLDDLKRDSLFFSKIIKPQNKNQSRQSNNPIRETYDRTENYQKPYRYNQKPQTTPRKNSKLAKNNIQTKKQHEIQSLKNITPNQDLFFLFKNNQLSSQHIQQMEKNQFKNLVIVSVILPYDLMRKTFNLLHFSEKQYKISMPSQIFSSQFIKLNNPNTLEQIEYVFWFYEYSQEEEKNMKNSGKSSHFDIRQSSKSYKSIRQEKFNRNGDEKQQKQNLKRMMIQIPQIVITSKYFIKQNPQLFFASSNSEAGNNKNENQITCLHSDLDVQKTLLYFDQDENISNFGSDRNANDRGHIRSKQQNGFESKSKSKLKNPQRKSSSYIQIQPEEQFYESDGQYKQKSPILGEISKINTARSNYDFAQQKNQAGDSNLQIFTILQQQSIFKFVNHLPIYWLECQVSPKQSSKLKGQRKRKNSFTYNSDRQKYQKFNIFLSEIMKVSLRKNYQYSVFCSTWIFLHFLSNCQQINSRSEKNQKDNVISVNNIKSYSCILMQSLKSFKKQIQLRFCERLQLEYTQVIDQAILRDILRNIKKQELKFVKKNYSSIIYPINERNKIFSSSTYQVKPFDSVFNKHQNIVEKETVLEMQSQIMNFMDRMQEDIYFQNNKRAIKFNQKILQNEYQKIIQAGFRRQKLKKKQSIESNSSIASDQRPMTMSQSSPRKTTITQQISHELQKDFNNFMQAYSKKGIKVSTQLKTFNEFMEKSKHSYLKHISQLTKQKKKSLKEEQQKQNKNKMMKILQLQIIKLEQKRREVKQKNQIIKKKIKIADQKSYIDENRAIQHNQKYKHHRDHQSRHFRDSQSQFGYTNSSGKFGGMKKHNSIVQGSSSFSNQKVNRKSAPMSFQISNMKRNTSNQESKLPKKLNWSRYDRNSGNKQGQRSLQKGQKQNKQTIYQVDEDQKNHRFRCLNNKCCQIM